MKKTINLLCLLPGSLIFIIFISGCSSNGSGSTNEVLGKLPGLAENYKKEVANLELKLAECADMEKAFKLDAEKENLKDKANQAIDEYLTENPIMDVPFEQKADYLFTFKRVWVESSGYSRINFNALVNINEDILNNFGNPPGFARNFFAYFIAIDKEGNPLTPKAGVMMNLGKSPFKAGMETEVYGSLDGPADLQNFHQLVFINKEEYDNPQ